MYLKVVWVLKCYFWTLCLNHIACCGMCACVCVRGWKSMSYMNLIFCIFIYLDATLHHLWKGLNEDGFCIPHQSREHRHHPEIHSWTWSHIQDALDSSLDHRLGTDQRLSLPQLQKYFLMHIMQIRCFGYTRSHKKIQWHTHASAHTHSIYLQW